VVGEELLDAQCLLVRPGDVGTELLGEVGQRGRRGTGAEREEPRDRWAAGYVRAAEHVGVHSGLSRLDGIRQAGREPFGADEGSAGEVVRDSYAVDLVRDGRGRQQPAVEVADGDGLPGRSTAEAERARTRGHRQGPGRPPG